jgi:hypothetical protein
MDIDRPSPKQLIEERQHVRPDRLGLDLILATKSLAQIRKAPGPFQQLPYTTARYRQIQIEAALGMHHNEIVVDPPGNPPFTPSN